MQLPETLTQWLDASGDVRRTALQASLERIARLDPSIHAWVQVLPQDPTGDGKLSEIPVGVKDIIETKGLLTEFGSALYKGRISTEDAAIVRELRCRGAVVLGKTQTAAFAYRTPAPTCNPRNPAHTPGGSSSGSAAAVAAGMVPFTVGTQTKGSVLRPASYCGVTGFKASYGLLPMDGVLPFATSFDTLGFFTHRAADMLALWDAMGHPVGRTEDLVFGAPEPWPEVEAAMAVAFRKALARLRKGGLPIRPVALVEMLAKLCEAAEIVMSYEAARIHRQRFDEFGSRLGDLAGLVCEGLQLSADEYKAAQSLIADCKMKLTQLFETTPVLLVPAATGPAPYGLASTGDARMNSPWTALGTPALSIPMPVGGALPLGLQLTAAPGEDARVIRAAILVQGLLGDRELGA